MFILFGEDLTYLKVFVFGELIIFSKFTFVFNYSFFGVGIVMVIKGIFENKTLFFFVFLL